MTGPTSKAAHDPLADIKPGDLFAGRFRIDRPLGRGGMGAVFLAEQEPLGRKVAIKILHGTADSTTAARFQREARLIAQLSHPHIVSLIDFGEDAGRIYLVLEFIDGEPLTALLQREGALAPHRVVELGRQIAEALSVAHDIQVVHRDVKPDNVMVLRSAAGQDFVKMLDFGVAKINREGDAQNTIQTKAGLIVGSLRYISPEQVETGAVTTRADIYSLGCILYEMLTGGRVFEFASPADCAIAHLTQRPRPPSLDGQPLEGPLVDLIMRCLEKKPGQRPADGREVLQALEACREQPVTIAAAPDEDKTVHLAPEALARLESAAQPLPAETLLQDAQTVDLSGLAAATAAVTTTSEVEREARPRVDVELRRATATHEFNLGQAQKKRAPPAPKAAGRTWLWVLLALFLAGGAVAAWALTRDQGTPSPASRAASAAPPTTSGTGAERKATTATAPEAQPAERRPPDPAPKAPPAEEPPAPEAKAPLYEGTHLVTTPPGAQVMRDGQPLCETPCTFAWPISEKPPRVRLTLAGHADIDLQLVRGDHGTEQRFELRPTHP